MKGICRRKGAVDRRPKKSTENAGKKVVSSTWSSGPPGPGGAINPPLQYIKRRVRSWVGGQGSLAQGCDCAANVAGHGVGARRGPNSKNHGQSSTIKDDRRTVRENTAERKGETGNDVGTGRWPRWKTRKGAKKTVEDGRIKATLQRARERPIFSIVNYSPWR